VKQLKVSLPDGLRAALEETARASGRSISEEIRRHIERSMDTESAEPQTRELMAKIDKMAAWVKIETRHDWHAHPAAMAVLRSAIAAHMARLRSRLPGQEVVEKPDGTSAAPAPATFAAGELPVTRVVAPGTDDPDAIGMAIETLVFHTPPETPERRRRIEEARRQMLQQLQRGEVK
jgi:hypothetical protein